MKAKISTGKVILTAVIIEAVLISLQFITVGFGGDGGGITTEYIQSRGFFIFQILGFFAYAVTAFILTRKHASNMPQIILMLVITGGIIEIGFYIISQAQYQGAYLYSILDKVIGAVSGWIVGRYSMRWSNLDIPQ